MGLEISNGSFTDFAETKALIKKVFMRFEAPDYSEEGVAHFMKYLDEKLPKEIAADQVKLWCGKKNQRICGVLAVRLPAHIALLFVDEAYHRQGIAKKLYQAMQSELAPEQLTVNSSPYAVPIYHKLGFRLNGEEATTSGIRYQPMIFNREDAGR